MFTKEDIERIRRRMRARPFMLDSIKERHANVRRKLYIQTTGIGTWYHYFVCPRCGVRLTFDYDNNEQFICPNCQNVLRGEPYLGAWWETVLCMTTSAAYELAVAYVGTGDAECLDVAKRILLGYADNYIHYEVHGGIPYNKPGRFLSQVLSDCEPICDLCCTYALLKNELSEDERAHVERDLLRPAAEHQMKHMTPQLHNHEVAICTSVAAVGLSIGDEQLIRFATDEPYGLKYQIDHAYHEDGFWFEGSSGYHLYALKWFMKFERMAKQTAYSLFASPHYASKLLHALLFLKNIYIGNNCTVKLNDGGGSLTGHEDIFEYAYSYFKDDRLLPFLFACYEDADAQRATSLTALMYGVDTLPPCHPEIEKTNYLSTVGSNLAMLRGSDDRYLLLKALPYGGEHDHYDRLALSFDAFGKELCVDLGTASGYGSPLHYGYYKNTATHNTVVIDGENMPPCDTVVKQYRLTAPGEAYLDAYTNVPEDYVMLDSFTIKQWNDEAYRGVQMRRIILWQDAYFIDIFSVQSDNERRKEWTWHTNGHASIPQDAVYVGKISDKGAQSYFDHAYRMSTTGVVKCEYVNEDVHLDIYALADGLELFYAEGPGNPANLTVSYLLERSTEKSPVYVNVIEAHRGQGIIDRVEASVDGNHVNVAVTQTCGRVKRFSVAL